MNESRIVADARPERVGALQWAEDADPGYLDLEPGLFDPIEGGGDVLGHWAVNVADETDG